MNSQTVPHAKDTQKTKNSSPAPKPYRKTERRELDVSRCGAVLALNKEGCALVDITDPKRRHGFNNAAGHRLGVTAWITQEGDRFLGKA